jgi:hypothetical protein
MNNTREACKRALPLFALTLRLSMDFLRPFSTLFLTHLSPFVPCVSPCESRAVLVFLALQSRGPPRRLVSSVFVRDVAALAFGWLRLVGSPAPAAAALSRTGPQ